jgi:hypothetical protein
MVSAIKRGVFMGKLAAILPQDRLTATQMNVL